MYDNEKNSVETHRISPRNGSQPKYNPRLTTRHNSLIKQFTDHRTISAKFTTQIKISESKPTRRTTETTRIIKLVKLQFEFYRDVVSIKS